MIVSIKAQTIPQFTYDIHQLGGYCKFYDYDGINARWSVSDVSREDVLAIPGVVGVE